MVLAAGVLLWALLPFLGSQAARTHQTQTRAGLQHVSFHIRSSVGGSARSTRWTSRPQMKVTLEDEDDAVAAADQLTGPAAAELLASTVATGISHSRGSGEEEGVLEDDDVFINARKNGNLRTHETSPSTRFTANSKLREIRLTTNMVPSTLRSTGEQTGDELMESQETLGSTPNRWPPPSPTAMPPVEDLQIVLMPWGPWHCHCKSGTMSRSRSGKLLGIRGRLRPGALSQIRTEHRPCTYQQCPCDRELEECPLDVSLCEDCSPQSSTSTPTSHNPSPALTFWKRVRIELEDIWNSLSSVFTEMQPVSVNGLEKSRFLILCCQPVWCTNF
ncbi:protein MENT [Rhynchocyon petersi]